MSARRRWILLSMLIGGAALGLVSTGTTRAEGAHRKHHPVPPPRAATSVPAAAAAAESAEAATSPATHAIGVARGGETPKLQPPALSLTLERFQDAFNADAGVPRLLIMLSPT